MSKRGLYLMLFLAAFCVLWCERNAIAAPIMVKKNLFNPERKQVAPQDQSKNAKKPNKIGSPGKSIQLDAVFYFGDRKVALLRVNPRILQNISKKTKALSPYVRVQEKDTVGTYQVVSIEPDKIILNYHGQAFEIPLFQQGKISPPPARLPRALPSPRPQKATSRPSPNGGKNGRPRMQSKTKRGTQVQPSRELTAQQILQRRIQLQQALRRSMNIPRQQGNQEPPDMSETLDELRRAIETLQETTANQ